MESLRFNSLPGKSCVLLVKPARPMEIISYLDDLGISWAVLGNLRDIAVTWVDWLDLMARRPGVDSEFEEIYEMYVNRGLTKSGRYPMRYGDFSRLLEHASYVVRGLDYQYALPNGRIVVDVKYQGLILISNNGLPFRISWHYLAKELDIQSHFNREELDEVRSDLVDLFHRNFAPKLDRFILNYLKHNI